jgi:hypothetical protein
MKTITGYLAAFVGASLLLTGCPVSTIEKPISSAAKPPVDTDTISSTAVSSDDMESDTGQGNEEKPFFVIVKLPDDAEEKLTDRQKFAIDARRKHPTTLRSEMVRVNFFKQEEKTLIIEAFGKKYTAVKTKERKVDRETFSWTGAIRECADSSVEIRYSELRNWMSFAFDCNGLRYHLDPLSEGNHLMMEVNLKLWNPKDDQTSDFEPEGPDSLHETELDVAWKSTSLPLSIPIPILRVLVVYTTEAGAVVGNTGKHASDAIDSMNESFTNSLIDYKVELAGILETTYQETLDAKTDLDAFRLTNDGNMDEIHSVRTALKADVAVLVRNMDADGNPGDQLCGKAAQIDATSTTAFSTVYWWCMTPDNGSYTFAHEIGHLHGCRHQPSWDASNTPFAYGHGYVVDGKWRTMMAVIDAQDDPPECPNDCDRLNYWSNPNVTKDGLPMGEASTNDEARVMRTRSTTISAFFSTPADYVVPNETLTNHVYKDYFATNTVKNNSTYVINSGAWGSFRAKAVTLKTGFHAKSGSLFTASRVL